ncbi:MAG TPA: DUF4915 domain-containing protein [Roseiarcus sp.]
MDDDASPPRDVFICYAGPDRKIADALGASLEAAELGVWWDARLEAGVPFESQIQRALGEARIVVAVLSQRTLTSEWVRWELSQASRSGLHIVPLLVDGARPEDLPPPLHLMPTLIAVPGADAAGPLVQRIRDCLAKMARSPSRPREDDARRRLASAAAATARRAADIKRRKGWASAPPSIVVGAGAPGSAAPALNRFATSDGFAAFLRDQRISVAFTSSHTDELYLLGHAPTGQLVIDVQAFRKPTGLFAIEGSLLVGTLAHVFRLENVLRPGQTLDGAYSHCYVPRIGYFTGVVDTHDVAQTDTGEALFVATRYNCLATASRVHSFKVIWRPPFVTRIVAEDRCHLNGVALRGGIPTYATAMSTTDSYTDGAIISNSAASSSICAATRLSAAGCRSHTRHASTRAASGFSIQVKARWVISIGPEGPSDRLRGSPASRADSPSMGATPSSGSRGRAAMIRRAQASWVACASPKRHGAASRWLTRVPAIACTGFASMERSVRSTTSLCCQVSRVHGP